MSHAPCPNCSAPIPYGQPRCGRCGAMAVPDEPDGGQRTVAMAQVPAEVQQLSGQPPAQQQAQQPSESASRAGAMMTHVAGAAMNMSSVFSASFKRAVPGWAAELKEPAGPSTGGGAQSQQPLTLVAQNGQRLAIGRVDAARRTVNIRTHAVVSRLCEQRFNRPFAVSDADYQRFIDLAGQLFRTYGFQVTHETVLAAAETSRPVPSYRPPAQGSQLSTWLLILLAAIVAALLAVAVAMVLR
ncbi:MAG: hypothetical protein R3B72_22415 [Polyangiaceae bacterium]